ncbi:ATP-binding SpoIIE family protein phosphatase [Streptomyces sp. NBC_00154]|uniref:ATP-binding SpoIIE family protein phosphatase n=1 Tax=Streptomyces sp. NBC_00154 TaxID=2975670 RepID=UPI00225A2F64|nr:ATP-binding SpoIIE family protein phosphatase [Streptomyces sp. NBC_00154]MCX5313215.1 SpoIIE family protein phosphatase [Streptomyces sp. NBC_00154]
MGPIPLQRDTVQRPGTHAGREDAQPVARTSLPGNLLAPAAARRFVRAALAEWTGLGLPAAVGFSDRLADDAVTVADELVTNAVVHAGTTVDLLFRLEEAAEDEAAALVLEVADHHPARSVRSERPGPVPAADPDDPAEGGRGLQVVAALAERWGITYRTGLKTVWARLPVDDWTALPEPAAEPELRSGLRTAELLAPTARRALRDDADWAGRGALSFLAEASDLLAGQLDEDIVAALAGQLLVPRLADWCAIWLEPENGGPAAVPRLASVWHRDEAETGQLRTVLEQDPIRLPERVGTGPVSMPWPGADEDGTGPGADERSSGRAGAALAYRITAGGRTLGAVLLGREGIARVPDGVTALIEDFVRRVGLAVGAARAYTRQATISRILQRGLLPSKVADIPGVTSSLVYEPSDDGVVGGDFYDIFACPGDRWCFILGDVQGSGPEAAVVTGLARPWLRLLAREGFRVGEVLDRLNRLLLDDAMETAEAAALMVAAAGGQHLQEGGQRLREDGQQLADGGQPRFLSLLYGEMVPLPGGGVRCTLASAGHPLPLLLRPDGTVRPAAEPQVLLGVVEDVAYESQSFDLAPGDSLLCVTDGVTERRSGPLMFDDGDGLARALAGCAGLTAEGIADRIKRAVHEFAERPPDDDLALVVLQAQ